VAVRGVRRDFADVDPRGVYLAGVDISARGDALGVGPVHEVRRCTCGAEISS